MSRASTGSSATAASEDRLKDDLDAIKADLAQLKADLRQASGTIADTAKASVGHAGKTVEDAAHLAANQGREALHSTERRISENPIASVGVALGVGVLLGAMLRRH